MDDYLIDRETLGKFVDDLIKLKPVPVNTPEELNTWREQQIKTLDDCIAKAIFGGLSDEQLVELNQILDRNEESPEVFQQFFDNAGLDLAKTMENVMRSFRSEYLGGENE